MPHEVLMPQLGMAQDSGIIVAWLKVPGEAVSADDPLMEVETDKATVEVPAGADGFLTELLAAAGDDVPVGDVIAVISNSAENVKAAPPPKQQSVLSAAEDARAAELQEQADEPAPAAKPVTTSNAAHSPKPAPSGLAKRVLASPKARLTAHERGIDLQALARQGISQPIHVADLDKVGSGIGGGPSVLGALANGDALAGLLAREDNPSLLRRKVLAAFACGAFRMATGRAEADIGVECNGLDGDIQMLTNPDRTGVSGLGFEATGSAVDLALHDLTNTRLTEFRPAMGGAAHLSVAGTVDGSYRLTLSFSEAALAAETAAAFLDNFAARIEDPIRHIL